MVGKVTQSTGAWYQVKSERQPIYTCKLRGKLRLNNWKLTNPVAVGDEVVFDLEKDKATGVITEILPRKNYIIRQSPRRKNYSQIIAAIRSFRRRKINVSQCYCSCNQPKGEEFIQIASKGYTHYHLCSHVWNSSTYFPHGYPRY